MNKTKSLRRKAADVLFRASTAFEDQRIADELHRLREETIARAARREFSGSRCELRGNVAYAGGELLHVVVL